MDKEKAFELLKDVRNVFNSLGITYWLTAGTLLGLYRDGEFIGFKDEDIDIGIFGKDNDDKIISKFVELGWGVHAIIKLADKTFHYSFKKYGIRIDVMLYYIHPNHNKFYYWMDKIYIEFLPMRFVEEFHALLYRGVIFATLSRVSEYLLFRYGEDWKSPLKKYSHFTEHTRKGCRRKRGMDDKLL